MAVTFKDGVILGMAALQEARTHLETDADYWIYRSRFENNHRRLHCQSSNRQADPSTRYHLVLPIWLSRRYAGRCRHCPIPAGPLCHAERKAPDDTDRSLHLPGDLLRQQGQIIVSNMLIPTRAMGSMNE